MAKKCPNCNTNNQKDSNFCSSCGKPFEDQASEPPTQPPSTPSQESYEAPHHDHQVPPPKPSVTPHSLGNCYYHPDLPAVYVCNRCGRPICRDDTKDYDGLILCPECHSIFPPPPPQHSQPPQPQSKSLTSSRAMSGFLTSLVAGIIIILNAALLLSKNFYNPLADIFPWIPFFGDFPPWVLIIIGVVLGTILVLGSILMVGGQGIIGSVIVLPAAVISLIFGGGFIAGFVLGLIGGILGLLGK